MRLALMQPTFDPWLGYFDLIDYADIFVFLDTVQLNRQSWQTRNRLLLGGKEHLFPLPVINDRSSGKTLIKEARLDFRRFDFRKKLIRTLEQYYRKSPYFDEVHPFLRSLIMYETPFLSEYNTHMIGKICEKTGIATPLVRLSETSFSSDAQKGALVFDVCRYFDADIYVSPIGAKEYLQQSAGLFEESGITVEFQYYQHPQYRQQSEVFVPYIGIFDILYNEGTQKALEIIRTGRKYENR
ncbi:WbqC family protein [Hydrogenimonas sp. SS33]|uniref:WbqC family protein n=1 Tax=Hydrogenimonas leucolamina TaxID=2954236 RepID=UPI00336BD3C3